MKIIGSGFTSVVIATCLAATHLTAPTTSAQSTPKDPPPKTELPAKPPTPADTIPKEKTPDTAKADRFAKGTKWSGIHDNVKFTITVVERAKETATLKYDPQGTVFFKFDVKIENDRIIVLRAERHARRGGFDAGEAKELSIRLQPDGSLTLGGQTWFDRDRVKNKPKSFTGIVGKPVTDDAEDDDAQGKKKKRRKNK